MKRYAILTVGILLMATGAFAQATASATAEATIVGAITITNVTGLNFGYIAPGTNGTDNLVTVDPDSGAISENDDALLLGGTVSRAQFSVTGQLGMDYTMTIPVSPVTISFGANTMSIALALDATPSRTFGAAAETHYVGGTLTVPDGQPVGTYTGTFDVNANYN